VAVLVALCGAVPARPSEVLSPAYRSVVRRYAAGDRERAVAELRAWPDPRIRLEVPIHNRDWQLSGGRALDPGTWRDIPVRSALMLHTDCALRARRDGKPPRLHEEAAWSIARTFREDPAHGAFARRWYEAFAEVAQADYRWGDALDWAERGLRDFPASAELLLVTGSIEEMLAVQAAQAAPRAGPADLSDPGTRRVRSELLQRREVEGHLEKARPALSAAVAADPSLAEAHLRLGRVAWRLGEAAEARAELQAALERSPGGRTAFLARLFLGRLDEDGARLDEAVASYEAALAIDARAQSARLALSHARLRRGDAGAARRAVEEALTPAGERPQPDAFWLYPWGPAVDVEDRLQALRREASS
jgi:tetratricopeptide (TPR) repeat protein